MDFCRNNAPLSPPGDYFQAAQLDDLFPAHTAEVDMSLEWLSVFVEDCLTSTGNCVPPPPANDNSSNVPTTPPPTNNPSLVVVEEEKKQRPLEEEEEEEKENPTTGLQKLFVVPGRARSKRKRVTSYNTTTTTGRRRRRSHHQSSYDSTMTALTSPWSQPFLHYSVEPPMLQQEYWLAESELIFPQNEGNNNSSSSSSSKGKGLSQRNQLIPRKEEGDGEEDKKKVVVWKKEESHDENGEQQEEQQQVRRCTHCLSQRTPQWRAGPLGPKTLCNACGVRYKSGRLLPEYRPAKSPTFVSFLHSNSHKKVLEMRSSGSGPASIP